MAEEPRVSGHVYVACVPHVPLLSLQASQRQASAEFWQAYDARVAEFDAFDPELVIQFGSDHYSNVHLDLMPSFLLGHQAQAIGDCGGLPGRLDVPMELTTHLAVHLVEHGFDIATSHAMKVDHGFSNALSFFLHGDIGARPVIPIFINAMAEPRPRMERCRMLGETIGAWAATLGRRVAFLGSGGLSHETGAIFPQYRNAPNDQVRDYIVHGGRDQGISDEKWHGDIGRMMEVVSTKLIESPRGPGSVKRDWDEKFLKILASDDLSRFDDWADLDMVREGGQGGSEVRMWLAAVAAARAAGCRGLSIDYYSDETTIAVGAGIVHAAA